MYQPRRIDRVLTAWKELPERKPLVLRGARQTGKSSALRHLGHSFELFIELNLERFEDLRLVRSCRSAEEFLTALAVRHNVARFPEHTLLFLDEIQESPEAISWLRFFHEDHPELAVVAAGSLLEVRLADSGLSFPVGRVTFRTLRPMSFFEFLHTVGRDVLETHLGRAMREGRPVPEALHGEAMDLLRDYLLVGGMPEAVVRWAESRAPAVVGQVHGDLVQALAEDIQKYRGDGDVAELEAAFDNLKHHYGRRFRYENFAPGFKSQRMKRALGKLEGALLVTRVRPTSSLALPLAERARSAPKLLPLDVGLALHAMGTSFRDLRTLSLDDLLDGRLAEIFVSQQLLVARDGWGDALHFWVSESSRGNAELDVLLAHGGEPVPVEVKAGASGSLKSLHQFLWRSSRTLGLRFHAGPWGDEIQSVAMPDGRLDYRLLSLPLYLAEETEALLDRIH